MAKISVLPVADALTGDEHLPIVQRNSTKRVTMAAFRDMVTPYFQYFYKGDQGETGPADNSYTSYAAMQASDPTRKSARLIGDTDPNPRADGPYNNPTGTVGGWVPQGAAGIQVFRDVPGALPQTVQDEADSFAIRPEVFGATGTGLSDDTAALQAALDTGLNVRLTPNRTYIVTRPLVLNANNVSLTGGGTIKINAWDFSQDPGGGAGNHLRVLFVKGAHCTITGIIWDATGVTPGTGIENGFVWGTGPHLIVANCQFFGMPKGTCVWGLSSYTNFGSNMVEDCAGAVFVRGRMNVIALNIITNATDAAIAMNGRSCIGTIVNGNVIENAQGAVIPAMIAAEEGASRWSITNNQLIGVNGGGINAINVLDSSSVEGGIIANNEIDARLSDGTLPTTTNPAAMVSITESYRGIKFQSNKLYGVPKGPSNSRMAVFPATETEVYDNVFDGAGASGVLALVDILAGNGGIIMRNNKIVGFPGVRLVLINAGNYGFAPINFEGGRFLNGALAIDGELAIASILGLVIHIQNIKEVTTPTFISAATTIGYRGVFLNEGAWKRPHRIAEATDMFGSGIPGDTGGTMGIAPGDTVTLMDPGYPGKSKGYVYTANGAVWRPWGAI